MAIDPKPMSGDPHYEVAPLLWNRWDELAGPGSGQSVRDGVRRRFHATVDAAGLDEDRARDWVVVRMLHNALWELEDHPVRPGHRLPHVCVTWPRRSRSRSSRRHGSQVRSVNVGRPREATWATIGRTSMLKEQVVGPVAVHELGLEGDEVSNLKYHGGPDKAVYAFAREDLDLWAERLGAEIADGQFAENLTTEGIDVNEAEIGERWRIGGPAGPVLEITGFRTPCNVFKAWMGRSGYDDRAWVKRFALEARPGPYLRVVVEGTSRPATRSRWSPPGNGTTVTQAFRAAHGL